MKTNVDYWKRRVELVKTLLAAWQDYHLGAPGGVPPLPVDVCDLNAILGYIAYLEQPH